MYIRSTPRTDKKTGKKYVSYQLVESIRTCRGPRQNVLLTLDKDIGVKPEEHKILLQRLNEIMGQEEKIWNQIEVLASEKKAKSYDQAVELLIDLRDLAQREKVTDFSAKFDALKQRHSSKSSFIQRLRNVSV